MAMRALLQISLVDMSTVVADGVGDVEGEVVTPLLCSNLQQVQILLFREVLVEVHVECRTTSEVFDIWCAMQFELIKYGE